MSDYVKMNLSFAGCGFLGIYHVGVAVCFRKYAPHLLLNKISGASVGAIAACNLLCDLPLGDLTSNVLGAATEARKKSLGPFSPSFNINKILLENFEKYLPDDAHIRVSGKLHISLTRLYDGKNVIVSQFDTRDELIQALLATAFIPVFSGILPPKLKGVRYMDGGCSDNLPTLDENTITVSPFCGESDICPRDDSSQLFHINVANTSIELSKHNIYRIIRILFPPKPEVLSNMCKQGFDDALRFLHRNNLINCTRCLAVQSTFVVSEKEEENVEYDPHCQECKVQRQEALASNMPDTVVSIFQEAIESANKGLYNWLFKHRGMKLLSVMSLPYTLPADIMYATFTKLKLISPIPTPEIRNRIYRKLTEFSLINIIGGDFEINNLQFTLLESDTLHRHLVREQRFMATAPQVGNSVWEMSKCVMDNITHLLHKVNKKRQQISAQITCQLAITEYGNKYDVEACQDCSTQNKINLNFTLNLNDSDLPLDQSPCRKLTASEILKRQPSLKIDRTETDNDTFEHILQVTSQQENIMTYYYMDENNKVKVTEIFDVTESDSEVLQTTEEKHVNKNLQFDDDWDESTWTSQQDMSIDACNHERHQNIEETSEYSLEDILDKDTSNLFSDPESEWTGGMYKVEEPEDEPDFNVQVDDDLRPESDQPNPDIANYIKNYKTHSFTFDT